MELDFGHRFIPRIASQNYKAVDRCLGPDTLLDAPLDLPWAIVDAQWAEMNQEFLLPQRISPVGRWGAVTRRYLEMFTDPVGP